MTTINSKKDFVDILTKNEIPIDVVFKDVGKKRLLHFGKCILDLYVKDLDWIKFEFTTNGSESVMRKVVEILEEEDGVYAYRYNPHRYNVPCFEVVCNEEQKNLWDMYGGVVNFFNARVNENKGD